METSAGVEIKGPIKDMAALIKIKSIIILMEVSNPVSSTITVQRVIVAIIQEGFVFGTSPRSIL